MSSSLWVVRAGREAAYIDEWRTNNCIAVNFDEFEAGDLRGTDEAALRGRATTPAERTYASQLSAFAYRLEVGDLVVVPQLPKRRAYLVGEVTGGYIHKQPYPASGPHRRAVRWLGEFDRSELSQAGVNTLGAIQTVFRPTAVEGELRNLLTNLTPWEAAKPGQGESAVDPQVKQAGSGLAVSPVSTPAQVPLHAELRLAAQGRITITCDHPALVMQQVPRHVEPDAEWRDVPGVYVLTGTELVQSVKRTGTERTLTMTSIVRPWAYMGLSEKLFERLSSHRQQKEEWRRALLVRSGATPFSSDDIKYLELRVYELLKATDEVTLTQSVPNGNTSAVPRNPAFLDQCADAIVAVLRLTGTLI